MAKLNFGLFVFYLAAFEAGAFLASAKVNDGPRFALSSLSCVWIGLLCGISFMESFTKFQSKLLERSVALDVGRLVFNGLNTLEVAIALSMATVLYRFEQPITDVRWNIPLVLFSFLGLQILFLTPKLDLRAMLMICDELAKKKYASRNDEKIFKEFKAKTTLKTMPDKMYHHVYIVMEIAKIGLLLRYAYTL